MTLILILDLLGTFAFAVSGIKFASGKQIDWFGAYIIGLVTAIGGGTTRDLLLGLEPFWMTQPHYMIVTGVALLAAIVFKQRLFRFGNAFFIFDTLGLGLFTVAGISRSLDAEQAVWVCIVMGMISGSVGGVVRDVLINEVPLIFRKDIYALTCVAGGLVYFLLQGIGLSAVLTGISSALVVILFRMLAVRYSLRLPILGEMGAER